jgi:S-DNA-T family DNA segregation ATPase FtsK/SpoIIIE
MELLLRVHTDRRPPLDVAVGIDAEAPVARLAEALCEAAGIDEPDQRVSSARTGQVFDPDEAVSGTGIVSGDELVLGWAHVQPATAAAPIRGVSVDVLAGPDSGHSAVLDRGSYLLGRDRSADLTFGDVSVSHLHLRVDVEADWTVRIAPHEDPQNGVLVNDEAIIEPTVVGPDDVVALGSSRVSFREFIRAEHEAIDRLGQIEFHRTPYRPHKVRERELEPFGPIPARPEPRRFQLLAVLAPLAAGALLFAFSRQVQFLAIIAISPLVMIGTWIEDRRSGRHRFEDDVARFEERIVDFRADIAAAREAERVERVRAAPDLADLARRAELRTIDLWPRGREDDDFLRVRLGLGDAPSLVAATLASGGDDEFRERVEAVIAGHETIGDVPITVGLADLGVVGVHGPPEVVDDVVSSVLVQVACLHSPEDLVVVGALGTDRPAAEWLKWLPHVRSATSPLAGDHLCVDPDDARRLLNGLVEVADRRLAEADSRVDRRWPWLLAVLDGDLGLDATVVSQLLDRAQAAGISVLWCSSSEGNVPRQARSVVDCGPPQEPGFARLWSTDPDVDDQAVELGQVHPDVADRVARSLAAVRDASVATATTAIPRVVPLLSVLGTDRPDADWVLRRWRTETGYGLAHPVGLGPDGVFSLDLVADGPHALIGGTSGAGKSELLQSMVASLISCHPPNRLNLLFVDYKGGASSTVFRDVPHTVGYVTNLDATLSRRALTSLRAELDRRMRLMEGRAKDLADMLEQHPDEAPPSLVIVVDEFATLVKEVPEFVAGVVDIAQRGRSLGIHLILATQRPSGSVNENILANTNLRIALRMLDNAESGSVIGSPEAAGIPVPLRGRGYARLGPHDLVPFQSAFAGAPLDGDAERGVVVVRSFDTTGVGAPLASHAADADAEVPAATGGPSTHLEAVLAAVIAAHERSGLPPSRPPWREMLPDHVTLDDLSRDPRYEIAPEDAGRVIALGLLDAPEDQDQYPAVVDLEDGGGLLVFGAGGAGKTTLLRTAVVSATRAAAPGGLAVFGIDFASRALKNLEALPEVAAVAGGDDLEGVTRIIALLGTELERRRTLLADARADTLSAYRAQSGADPLPRILLVVDGYANLVASMTGSSFASNLDEWLEALHRVVIDGRQAGIHVVLAAERRTGVPALVQSAIAHRLVLRQADPAGYAELGIPLSQAADLDLDPGRGLWRGGLLVQVACVSEDGDGRAQAEAVLAEAGGRAGQPAPIRTEPLPVGVLVTDLPGPCDGRVAVGVADLTLDPVWVDVDHSHVLVTGVPRSGRSTTARVLADGLEGLGHEVWKVGRAGSPLAEGADLHRSAFGRPTAIQPVLEELADLLDGSPTATPRVLVADDLDALEDAALNPLWERIAGHDGVRVVATIENRAFTGFSMNALLNEVRGARRVLVLRPDDPLELFQMTGVKAQIRPGTPMPPGRGVLLADRIPTLVQVAQPAGTREVVSR